jgi:hypothetical protein
MCSVLTGSPSATARVSSAWTIEDLGIRRGDASTRENGTAYHTYTVRASDPFAPHYRFLLEPLLRAPYRLSPAWLRIDPEFAPFRGNPRLEQFLAGRRKRTQCFGIGPRARCSTRRI